MTPFRLNRYAAEGAEVFQSPREIARLLRQPGPEGELLGLEHALRRWLQTRNVRWRITRVNGGWVFEAHTPTKAILVEAARAWRALLRGALWIDDGEKKPAERTAN